MKTHLISLTESMDFSKKYPQSSNKNKLSLENQDSDRKKTRNKELNTISNDNYSDSFDLDSYFQNKSSEFYRKLKVHIDKFKQIIKSLTLENYKLKEINEMLTISINRKEDFILKLIKENKDLSENNMKITSKYDQIIHNINKNLVSFNSYENSKKSGENHPILIDVNQEKFKKNLHLLKDKNISANKFIKIKENYKNISGYKSNNDTEIKPPKISISELKEEVNKEFKFDDHQKEIDEFLYKKDKIILKNLSNTSNTTSFKFTKNFNQKEYDEKENKKSIHHYSQPMIFYEKIFNINQNRNKKRFGAQKVSFLNLKEDFINKFIKNETVRELFLITNNEEEFIKSVRTDSEEKLTSYCDLINSVIKDYLNSLKLLNRIKYFLSISMSVNSSMLVEEATNLIIKNACLILNCDRTTIFVLEKLSNLLTVHTGEGINKNDFKVPNDKGIVGYVFTKGEKLKIDDAYQDERFNKEIDRKTNYSTKTILCLPLRNVEGNVVGVLQSINKRDGLFNQDDEELMEFFVNQVSSILSNSMNYDENTRFISRLKMLSDFSIKLQNNNKEISEITIEIENLLMKFWSVNIAIFYVFNHEEQTLMRITKYEVLRVDFNYGLIGLVCKNKEFVGINRADDSSHYNSNVDIETGFSIITFPILNQKDKVLAVVQFAYPYKLTSNRKLKENDMTLLNMLSNLLSLWLENNPLN